MPRNSPPKEKTQEWLDSVLRDPKRCHYFTVIKKDGATGSDNRFGTWDAPFFDMEEAKQFKDLMHTRFTNARLIIGKGEIPSDDAFSQCRNRFWVKWLRKHKQRIKTLTEQQSGAMA
ncbi:TPA: hypothetical protein JI393_RS14355 [Acinetobacter baumannii]|uniref:hypothetical protein n=1 Tax=Acinetobacter indicus TaxID=756892 RepID=UPI000CEC7239|nr:hypothetical protein [Acinetobacter indicus]HBI1384560.1 hypothetical protein [Acinetobacter baumannii]HBI9064018.1 hypothetical protein [Acinetobacter baumannii]